MIKLLHFVERLLGIYRWHPTIALRYLPLVDVIKKAELENSSIIEIGSGGLGIVPYIHRSVVGVDITFSPPLHPQLIPVIGSSTKIPFADDSFDVVVSTDMLEHIPQNLRETALNEMMRIARKLVCIGVPSGSLAQEQDSELARIYTRTHQSDFNFFSEHEQLGLPNDRWLLTTIEQTARKLHKPVSIKQFATLNLSVRRFLMRGWISDNFVVNFIFRKVFLLGIPLLRHINQSPCYRHHFVITIN